LIHFHKKSLEGGEKRNEFIKEELGSEALTRRVTRLKRVCNIPKTIFEKRKLTNGCKERKLNKGAHTFKEGSSRAHKWERIDYCPFHTNLKTITLQIRPNLLEN
jgi:hypothetical protein